MTGEVGQGDGRPRRRPGIGGARLRSLLIVAVGSIHRSAIFVLYRADLEALVRAQPEWLTWHFQTAEALRGALGKSLLYLQQTPPIPNLIVGLALRAAGSDLRATYALVAIQGALSLAAAALLERLVVRLTGWRYLGLAAGLVFVLDPDVLVLEYSLFGQVLHEKLTMVLLLLGVHVFFEIQRTGRLSLTAGLGALTSLLALSRASYSYFFVVIAALLPLAVRRRRGLHLAAFLAAWAPLHGGWVVKNYLVYGDLRLATSSWAGCNAVAGLDRAGLGGELRDLLESGALGSPGWLVELVRQEGLRSWDLSPETRDAFLPAAALAEDRRIQRLFGGRNRGTNSVSQRVLCDAYLDAYKSFAWRRPQVLAEKLHLGYALYWFPIRYYGYQYLNVFATEWRVERSLRPLRLLRQLVRGEIPEAHLVNSGLWSEVRRRPGRLYTLDLPVVLLGIGNLLILHLLLPVVVLGSLRHVSWSAPPRPADLRLWLLVAVYGYGSSLPNLVEFNENMRFRLAVEPIIWALSAVTLARTASWLSSVPARLGRRSGPPRPTSTQSRPRGAAP